MIVRHGTARRATMALAMFCSFAPQAVSAENIARAHVDSISICSEFEGGMPGLLQAASSLGWRALENADYAKWGRIIQEIEWFFLASHDPFTGANANVTALIQMQEAIASNDKQARQYVSQANPKELFGDDTRRLLTHNEVEDAIVAVLYPGDYGANATCAVISEAEPPLSFISLLEGLNEIPPENVLLTTALVKGVAYPASDGAPRSVFVVREIAQDRLTKFTDYKMNATHTFELRIYSTGNAQ